jgi:hypothetical protein
MIHRKMIRKFACILIAMMIGSVTVSNLHQFVTVSANQIHVNLDNPAVPFSKNDTLLHIQDSQIYVNGELLFSVGGKTGGFVIWFFSPKHGRYIFSTKPHPKYEFERVKVIANHRIVFSSMGKEFEWVVSASLVEKETITELWMMHDKHPEPIKDRKGEGGEIGASTHYEYLFPSS